jgi:predicted GNAT family acetyltransferase
VLSDVDPAIVASLSGLRKDLFSGGQELIAYADAEHRSGLVVFETGLDVCISAVATRPESRGRGLATAITRRVLEDSRDRGFVTASLQATAAAEGLYHRLGFRPLYRWQEWIG